MPTGVLRRPLHERGFGFITPDGGGRDVWMHVGDLASGTEADLVVGARLSYETVSGPKGPKATEIRVISGAAAAPAGPEGDDGWHQHVLDMAARCHALAADLDQLAAALDPNNEHG